VSIEGTRFTLAPEYKLYPEAQGVVLYSRNPFSSHERYILPPDVGFVLALCDGSRSHEEITATVSYVFSTKPTQAANHVHAILEHFRDLVLVPASEADLRWSKLVPSYDSFSTFLYEPDSAASFRAQHPYCLIYIATQNCVRNCLYCYADSAATGRHREETLLPFARLAELVREAGKLGVGVINLTGGDPFVRKDIEDIILLILENGIFPWVSTKARVSKGTATRLAHAGLPVMQVSIDACDKAIQDDLCQCEGSYEDITHSIAALVESGIGVYTNTVVTAMNVDHIPDLVAFLKSQGVMNCQLTPYARSLGRHSDSLFATNEQWKRLLSWYEESADQDHVQLRFTRGLDALNSTMRSEGDSNDGMPRSTCTAGKEGFVILPGGLVTVCERLASYTAEMPEVIAGDVSDSSITEIWNSPCLSGFAYPQQERYAGTTCGTCTEFENCSRQSGRCYVRALAAYGKLFAPDPLCSYAPKYAGRLL